MHKKTKSLFFLVCFTVAVLFCVEGFPQQMNDVSSEHILMRLPKERALLGRRVIADLERFYQFLNGTIDVKLPRRIMILIDWDLPQSRTDYERSSIVVGMNQPAAVNAQSFLLKESMREIAHFGLLELSKGADRPDYIFLYEGMIEILVNEFRHTSRGLESAWVIAQYLDEMGQLSLSVQRDWENFSKNRRNFRNASPGITFLLTFRELKGREKPNSFFETLRKANLSRSLQDAFDDPPSELEKIWLNAVRGHPVPNEITITTDEVPQLTEVMCVPETVSAGEKLKLRFLFKADSGVLLPDGVFIKDGRTGKVYSAEEDSEYISCIVPIETGAAPGQYGYDITAVDESGNLRRFKGTYIVASDQSSGKKRKNY
jgi:hypothetical protein